VTTVQPGGGPTVRRMLVGAQLRRLRTDKEITRERAGEAIRASEWKIHRLENGQVSFKERDVVDLLRLYGVTDPGEVAALLTMAREANQPGWWFQYSDLLPHWFRAYVDLESAAAVIRIYEGQLVPGLLQTEEYTRAVIHGAQLDESAEEVERRVALRMARQGLLERAHAPRLWAVVTRRPCGGRSVVPRSCTRRSNGLSRRAGCLASLYRSCRSTPVRIPPWWADSASCGLPAGSYRTSSISSI
jgi:hypothetical protein